MLYHSFPLECFKDIKQFVQIYMNQFNIENIYVKNVPMPENLIHSFNKEMSIYGLSSAWNFLAFKRKNYFDETLDVHIDYSINQGIVYSSIILPIEGCLETKMYWVSGEHDVKPITYSSNNVTYAIPKWKKMPVITSSVEINDTPMLVKVDVPHSVTSRKDGSYRTILSIRLLSNPKFEEVLQKRFDNKS
jgi:hypothetical protein